MLELQPDRGELGLIFSARSLFRGAGKAEPNFKLGARGLRHAPQAQ